LLDSSAAFFFFQGVFHEHAKRCEMQERANRAAPPGNHSFNPIEEGALALKKSQNRGPAIDVVFVDGKLHCVYASGAT
jgi:hypothetical protein